VTHAVFGATDRGSGCLDEDMLWSPHSEPEWVPVVTKLTLQRLDEVLSVLAEADHSEEDLDGQTATDLSIERGRTAFSSPRVPPSVAGPPRDLPGSYLDCYCDLLSPPGRPLLLHELVFCLKRSYKQVLRGLVEVIAAGPAARRRVVRKGAGRAGKASPRRGPRKCHHVAHGVDRRA